MTIRKLLDLSTAHVTWPTAVRLDRHDKGLHVMMSRPEGWLLNVPEDWRLDHLPADVQAIFAHATRHGCDAVLMDCDGDIIADLPTYAW